MTKTTIAGYSDAIKRLAAEARIANRAPREPKIVTYARVSTDRQHEMGNSVPAQRAATVAFANNFLADIARGEDYAEVCGESAFKRPFYRRREFRKMLVGLRRGDHIVVDKVDRIYRRLTDFVVLHEYLKCEGITLHIVNLMGCSVSAGTPMGDLILGLFVMIAQLESATLSDRVKRSYFHRRLQAGILGFKRKDAASIGIGSAGKDAWTPREYVQQQELDQDEVAIMETICRWRDEGMGWRTIVKTLPKELDLSRYPKKFWDFSRCRSVIEYMDWLRKVQEQKAVCATWNEAIERVGSIPRLRFCVPLTKTWTKEDSDKHAEMQRQSKSLAGEDKPPEEFDSKEKVLFDRELLRTGKYEEYYEQLERDQKSNEAS